MFLFGIVEWRGLGEACFTNVVVALGGTWKTTLYAGLVHGSCSQSWDKS